MGLRWKDWLTLLEEHGEIRLGQDTTVVLTSDRTSSFLLEQSHDAKVWIACNPKAIVGVLRSLPKGVKCNMLFRARLPCDVDAILKEFPCVDRLENVTIHASTSFDVN